MNVPKIMEKPLEYGLKKPLNYLSDRKWMGKVCDSFQKSNPKFGKNIAAWAVGSMIAKDGIGCYLYVKQSLNNKDIPDDKRKFVAALDLANGGLMMLAQLIAFKTVSNEKIQEKIFNRIFGKRFDAAAKKGYETMITHKSQFKNITGKQFTMAFDKFHKNVKGTFGFFLTLVSSTILAKRVLVPFISTPLAESTAKILGKNGKKENNENKDTFTPEVKK